MSLSGSRVIQRTSKRCALIQLISERHATVSTDNSKFHKTIQLTSRWATEELEE